MDAFKGGTETLSNKMEISLDQNSGNSMSTSKTRNLIRKLMAKMANILPKTQRQVYFALGQTTNDHNE